MLRDLSEDIGVGMVYKPHQSALMLHLLKDQRVILMNSLKFKHLKYTGENTEYVILESQLLCSKVMVALLPHSTKLKRCKSLISGYHPKPQIAHT